MLVRNRYGDIPYNEIYFETYAYNLVRVDIKRVYRSRKIRNI